MTRALPLLSLAVLAACPGDDAPAQNAPTVWLAPNGSEVRVRLVESEPPPF